MYNLHLNFIYQLLKIVNMIGKLFIIFSFLNHAVLCLQPTDFYIHNLPLWPKEIPFPRMHAGHLSVNRQHHGALFFWHFARKYIADKERTVIWLNGGPGHSSQIGNFREIGPFLLQRKLNVEIVKN